jgi:hypothetical protein
VSVGEPVDDATLDAVVASVTPPLSAGSVDAGSAR